MYSEAPRFAGMLRPREYVTCDAEVPTARFFVCKSCLVPEGPRAQAQKGHVRANLLFAMRVKERKGTLPSSHLQVSRRPTGVPTWSLLACGSSDSCLKGLAAASQTQLRWLTTRGVSTMHRFSE